MLLCQNGLAVGASGARDLLAAPVIVEKDLSKFGKSIFISTIYFTEICNISVLYAHGARMDGLLKVLGGGVEIDVFGSGKEP